MMSNVVHVKFHKKSLKKINEKMRKYYSSFLDWPLQ